MNNLLNKKILVTKSQSASKNSLRLLKECGAEIIYLPTIKIIPIYNSQNLNDIITNPYQFEYIIFTSGNTVQIFTEMIAKYKIDLSKTKIAVVGKSTAEVCRENGIYIHIIPEEFSAKGLIKKFSEIGIYNKNILIPGSSLSREELKLGLSELGANVTSLPIYDVVTNDLTEIENEYQSVIKQKPDIFIFTSPSSFENYMKLLHIDKPDDYFTNKIICAIGPTTEFEIRSYGLTVNIVPKNYSLEGISEAIIKYFNVSSNIT